MSFFDKIFSGGKEKRSMTDRVAAFLRGEDLVLPPTVSGAYVDESNAMSLTAIYACVGLLSRTVASLPLHIFRAKDKGKIKDRAHPLYKLLHDAPNPLQTSYKWRELMCIHQNLWGAGISEIEFNSAGQPIALWPLPVWRIKPRVTHSKDIIYDLAIDNQKTVSIPAYRTVVFAGLSTSAYEWQSPIATHRETIGAAMSVKEFGARVFGQGTNPSGIITIPAGMEEASEEDYKKFVEKYKGLGKSHHVMLFEEGMKFERIGLPPEDAQYLQTRRFDISEIARIYNIPLFMLQDHEKQTSWGTGLEEQKDGFVTFTITPYLVQYEQELNRRLFFDEPDIFCQFSLDALLRGSLTDRYDAYVKGITNGFLSPNEARTKENLNPIPEGNKYLAPLNMQDLKNVGKEQTKEVENV